MPRWFYLAASITVVVLTIGVLAAMIATQSEPEKNEDPEVRPLAVFVSPVVREDVRLRVETQGEVRPHTEIDLAAQVSGRIVSVAPEFVAGGAFKAGEVLVQLEDADYRVAVTRAEARVAESRQRLVQEKAEADLARRDWEEMGRGPADPLTLREPQLKKAQADLAAAEAELEGARLNLARTRISVPFDGRVRSKNADLGQYVTPGAMLGRVFATDRVEVRLPLTDADMRILGKPIAYLAGDDAPGVRFTATVAGEERTWTGVLARIEGAVDPASRVVYAYAALKDPYGAGADAAGVPMAVGLFVRARIEGRVMESGLVVPRAALRPGDKVFLAAPDNTLQIRTVEVLAFLDERVVIASGLEVGEQVITSPLAAPVPGMPVRPIDEAEQRELADAGPAGVPGGDLNAVSSTGDAQDSDDPEQSGERTP